VAYTIPETTKGTEVHDISLHQIKSQSMLNLSNIIVGSHFTTGSPAKEIVLHGIDHQSRTIQYVEGGEMHTIGADELRGVAITPERLIGIGFEPKAFDTPDVSDGMDYVNKNYRFRFYTHMPESPNLYVDGREVFTYSYIHQMQYLLSVL
jgi:hypothetical protein